MKTVGNFSAVLSIVFMILSFINAFKMFSDFTIWRVVQLVFFVAMWMLFLGVSQKMLNPKPVKTNCKNCDRGFDDCIC